MSTPPSEISKKPTGPGGKALDFLFDEARNSVKMIEKTEFYLLFSPIDFEETR